MKKLFLKLVGVAKDHSLLFFAAFFIVCLININYYMLRSIRNTLTVSLSSAGAELIPAINFWALLPLTLLLIYTLSVFMRKHRPSSIFMATTGAFSLFFLIFALFVFPHRELLHSYTTFPAINKAVPSLGLLFSNWTAAIYYVAAELWKVAILSVLFFGFLNQRISLNTAKGLYSPILLGGSLGGLIAGPLTIVTTALGKKWTADPNGSWQISLICMSVFMALVGAIIVLVFSWLKKRLDQQGQAEGLESRDRPLPVALFESLKTIVHSRYLLSLCMMVVFDYVAYYLYEIYFLNILKKVYPDPSSYCAFNGGLVFWSALLTTFSALFVAPVMLKKCSWKVPALITPLVMMFFSLAFFTCTIFSDSSFIMTIASFALSTPMELAIIIGSSLFCMARAAKSTVFDASKELAFIPLPRELQSKGKLIVDGLASRTGCTLAAAVNQVLFSAFSSLEASMPCAAILSFGSVSVWIRGVLHVSRVVDGASKNASNQPPLSEVA